MSDEMNKNTEATPFKLAEARKKGQVSKSTELPQFFSLVAMIGTLFVVLGGISGFIAYHTGWWIASAHLMSSDMFFTNLISSLYIADLSGMILPVMLAGSIAVIVSTIVHIGPLFSLYPMKPDFSKMNPVKGLKKIFSRRTLVDLVRVLIKITAFSWVAYLVWQHKTPEVLTSNHASMGHLLAVWKSAFFTLAAALLGVFLVFALFDLWFSKKEFARQMKMSTREVKEENKKREGDPEIKSKQKRNLKELLNRSASTKNVKDSDVIITNPTHVAIALMYRPKTMALPTVVSKGRGLLAAHIRAEAKRYGIPIVRKPELARALLAEVRIGDPIPVEKQNAVASVYRWLLAMPNSKGLRES